MKTSQKLPLIKGNMRIVHLATVFFQIWNCHFLYFRNALLQPVILVWQNSRTPHSETLSLKIVS